ncbi:unnamed protein product [Calypogeia fissa]
MSGRCASTVLAGHDDRSMAITWESLWQQTIRIERLEIFDEFEEWHIMQEHYSVAFGINDPTGILEHVGFSIPKSVASHLGHSKSFSAT